MFVVSLLRAARATRIHVWMRAARATRSVCLCQVRKSTPHKRQCDGGKKRQSGASNFIKVLSINYFDALCCVVLLCFICVGVFNDLIG